MADCCQHCGQPLKQSCYGVYMPRLKAELLASIKAAGEIGISTAELLTMHYGGKKVQPSVIKSHVNQINDILIETDYAVFAEGRGPHARWLVGFNG